MYPNGHNYGHFYDPHFPQGGRHNQQHPQQLHTPVSYAQVLSNQRHSTQTQRAERRPSPTVQTQAYQAQGQHDRSARLPADNPLDQPPARPSAPFAPRASTQWQQSPLGKADWSPLLTAAELQSAMTTVPITLYIGKARIELRFPKGILMHIPYFANCLRNPLFAAAQSGSMTLAVESPKPVSQLINWCIRQPGLNELTQHSAVARYADRWVLPKRFQETCIIDFWEIMVRDYREDEKVDKFLASWYTAHRDHRMRYLVVHFLVCRKREAGLEIPGEAGGNLDLANECVKWDWVLEQAKAGMVDAQGRYRGHELFSRLWKGALTLKGIKEDFNPKVVDHGDEWLTDFLNA